MPPLDRRDFLRTSGFALLGLAAAACSNGNGEQPPPGDGIADTLDELTRGKDQSLQIGIVQPNLARSNDRLSLALLPASGQGAPFAGGTARAWVAKDRTSRATGPVDLEYHGEGFERGTYIGRVTFPSDGQWLLYVEAKPNGSAKTLSGGTTVIVGNRPTQPGKQPQPIPGEKAVSVPTPTTTDPRGVNPICTRTNPQTNKREICSMHTVSLDQALRAGKPVVLIVGTPAFCKSSFCGPVVDAIMAVQRTDLGTKATFVHVELFKDDKEAPARQVLAPAAAAWRIEAEPVVYYVEPDGTILDWTIGPSDPEEIAALTRALL